jgi:hypothetical protein
MLSSFVGNMVCTYWFVEKIIFTLSHCLKGCKRVEFEWLNSTRIRIWASSDWVERKVEPHVGSYLVYWCRASFNLKCTRKFSILDKNLNRAAKPLPNPNEWEFFIDKWWFCTEKVYSSIRPGHCMTRMHTSAQIQTYQS